MFGPSYKIATVAGIPVRVHVTLLLILPLLPWRLGWLFALGLGVALFTSIVFHELGHSLVAMRFGCRVREILLLPIGGAARMESMPRKPVQEFLMALAGPAVSVVLGVVLAAPAVYYLLAPGAPHPGRILGRAIELAFYVGVVNLGLAVFNLLPAFPMDGGRVLRSALTPRLGYLRATRVAATIGRTLAVGGILFGIYDFFHGRNHTTLLFVALFIYWAAGAEYRAVRLRELQRQGRSFWWAWPPQPPPLPPETDDRATVQPPPWRRGRPEDVPIRPVGSDERD